MTFVLMQNTSLPKYRPLSSTPKAAYLPVTSYIFLTYEACQLIVFIVFSYRRLTNVICEDRQMETCLHMDIYAYHYARRASAYKWFFNVFVNNHP